MRKLHYGERTFCKCQDAWGEYLDDTVVSYGGAGVIFGIVNGDVVEAMNASRDEFRTVRAFRFARNHGHLRKVKS